MQNISAVEHVEVEIPTPEFYLPSWMLFWREGRVNPILTAWGPTGLRAMVEHSFSEHMTAQELDWLNMPEVLRYVMVSEIGTYQRCRIEFPNGRVFGYTNIPPVLPEQTVIFEDDEGDFEGTVNVGCAVIHPDHLQQFLAHPHVGDIWDADGKTKLLVDNLSDAELEDGSYQGRVDVIVDWTEISNNVFIPDTRAGFKTHAEAIYLGRAIELLRDAKTITLVRVVENHTGLASTND